MAGGRMNGLLVLDWCAASDLKVLEKVFRINPHPYQTLECLSPYRTRQEITRVRVTICPVMKELKSIASNEPLKHCLCSVPPSGFGNPQCLTDVDATVFYDVIYDLPFIVGEAKRNCFSELSICLTVECILPIVNMILEGCPNTDLTLFLLREKRRRKMCARHFL